MRKSYRFGRNCVNAGGPCADGAFGDRPPVSERGLVFAPHYNRAVERIFLLDGHSLAYRAFYALPETLATSTGQVTNAVYGFTSMLIKLLADEKPDHIAVAFDMGAPTVRLEKYADYKAGLFLNKLGLAPPGLSCFVVCKRP